MVKGKSKDIIIEAASKLFRLRGYDGVGLNDIIEESGIPKGSLYYYFPKGKEQLAIEAIYHTAELVVNEIRGSFERFDDPILGIQHHINQLADIIADSNNILGMPIGTIAGEKYSNSEPIRLACQSAFESWQVVMSTKFLAAGYSEQQSKDFALLINVLIEGGILLSLTTKSGNPLKVIATQIPLLLHK